MSYSAWASLRQNGSFRGVPFIVEANSLKRGRQVALHIYPFRDDPWPEDLGRSPRVTSFRGFLLGDDADQQMLALTAAVETPGSGQLVHPVLGSISVQVIACTFDDELDRGRRWSFDMSFVPAVARIYPVAAANTQAHTQGLFGSFGTAVAADFKAVVSTVQQVRTTVAGYVSTVQSYVGQAQGLIANATALAHLPAQLAGNFGRFAGGSRSVTLPSIGGSIAGLTGTVNGAFAHVSNIGGTLGNLASKL